MLKSIALTSLFATGSAFVAPAATASSSALRADVFGIEQEEALLNAKREGQDSWGAAVAKVRLHTCLVTGLTHNEFSRC